LKFIDDFIGDGNNLFKHVDLVLVPEHDDFDVPEEVVCRVASIDVEVNLSPYFFEENEVAFEDELHLYLIELEGFLFIFRLLLVFETEVVDLLEKLLIFL
jgi:hypothetical protein